MVSELEAENEKQPLNVSVQCYIMQQREPASAPVPGILKAIRAAGK